MSGYAGTTVDEITKTAGVARASFYTYFPSKRAALLALGAESLASAMIIVGRLGDLGPDGDVAAIAGWVSAYFGHLEEHGSFAFAWTQAAQQDSAIRRAGQRGHLEMCRRLGVALARLHGAAAEAPVESGLLVVGMLERVWAYSQLYGRDIDQPAVERIAVRLLREVEKPPRYRQRPAPRGGRPAAALEGRS
ncbi:TetR/AcrR family transcriptional regulator [Acidiferrimicrobium sp. IK]|nr:TetR/AcrR family transcriptional regulator [Acidiferrimicrobium sp. IK]